MTWTKHLWKLMSSFQFLAEKRSNCCWVSVFWGVNSSDAQMPHRSEPLDCAANLANMYSVGETHRPSQKTAQQVHNMNTKNKKLITLTPLKICFKTGVLFIPHEIESCRFILLFKLMRCSLVCLWHNGIALQALVKLVILEMGVKDFRWNYPCRPSTPWKRWESTWYVKKILNTEQKHSFQSCHFLILGNTSPHVQLIYTCISPLH